MYDRGVETMGKESLFSNSVDLQGGRKTIKQILCQLSCPTPLEQVVDLYNCDFTSSMRFIQNKCAKEN